VISSRPARSFTSNSVGTLRVDGGSFAVTNANLFIQRGLLIGVL
jgi:hypothetical protein